MKFIGIIIEIPQVEWCEKCEDRTIHRELPKEDVYEREQCVKCGHIREFFVVDFSFPRPDPTDDFWEPDPKIIGLDYIRYKVKEEEVQ